MTITSHLALLLLYYIHIITLLLLLYYLSTAVKKLQNEAIVTQKRNSEQHLNAKKIKGKRHKVT